MSLKKELKRFELSLNAPNFLYLIKQLIKGDHYESIRKIVKL